MKRTIVTPPVYYPLVLQQIKDHISDGTNTLITIAKNYPEHNSFILKSDEAEKLVITIEDNFSQLLAFRMSVNGHSEKRQ